MCGTHTDFIPFSPIMYICIFNNFSCKELLFLVRKCVVVPRVEYLMNTRNREKIRHGESENLGEHCSQSVTTPRAGNSIKGIFLG